LYTDLPLRLSKAAALALVAALVFMPAAAEQIDPADIRVIDGDTIQVFGMEPNVRLVGFDAPETWQPDCPGERELGIRTTARLRELVRGGHLTFEYVRCSCAHSKIGTHWCNWGRDCGTLRSNGRDVGDILITEGLAVPFICGATSCPKKPHPWCEVRPLSEPQSSPSAWRWRRVPVRCRKT
jgi:endonuclease YncB( thermonuclease family)